MANTEQIIQKRLPGKCKILEDLWHSVTRTLLFKKSHTSRLGVPGTTLATNSKVDKYGALGHNSPFQTKKAAKVLARCTL